MAEGKFYVISYDIVDDRKRFKAAEALKDYGWRVQRSVFEARLDAKSLEALIGRLSTIIDKRTDNVLIYLLCEGCVKQKKFLGLKIAGEDGEFKIL